MIDRIAELTWGRPKLVLALVGIFVAVAAVVGHGVESHLMPAGFTDSASQSEQGRALLRSKLGYDADAGIVAVVRPPNGGALELTDPAVQREVARLTAKLRGIQYVGKAVNPLSPLNRAEDRIRGEQR